MVSIFTGLGSGAERGSSNVIGSGGLLGSGTVGRSGQQVMLNGATGNLMIQQRDEMLVGRGPDATIGRTYNSQGNASDENADNWRQSTDRRIYGPVGTKNVAGSTVKRMSADGSEITYTYKTLSRTVAGTTYNETAYFATDGAGAYDKLVWNGSNSWTWTDGDSQATETFAQSLGGDVYLISSAADAGVRTMTFAYVSGSPSHLDTVTTADGGWVKYTWSGNNIGSIETHYTDYATSTAKTITRTSYTYASNRLSTVTVDLTPENAVDSVTYVTTYGYDASGRVNSITESDGSSLTVGYDGSGRVQTLTQLVAGSTTRVTTIGYAAGYTTITDALSRVTRLDYDGAGNLTKVTLPPSYSGATQQVSQFNYNSAGDITSVVDALGNTTSFSYDSYGNSLTATDPLTHVVSRTYGLKNELLTETRTGSDAASAGASHTTRYTYDAYNRLRHIINADGRVQLFNYDSAGNLTKTWYYAGSVYNVNDLPPTTALTVGDVNTWNASASHLDEVVRSTMTYDLRGNLLQQIDYAAADNLGAPAPAGGTRVTDYVYDQAGQLLKRTVTGINPETFVYDGLGRLTASTDVNGATMSIAFYDSTTTTIVTLTTGLVQTSTYNKAGDLLDVAESGSNTTVGTAHGAYDQLGRLRVWADATSRNNYVIYDGAGRKVGDVDHDGSLVEYRYDADNRIVATIRYKNNLASKLSTLAVATTAYDLNAAGNRPASDAAADLWTWTVYDADGRVIETIDGSGGVAVHQYDASDRLVATTSYFNRLTATQLSTIRATLPTTTVLPTAGADAARDRVERNFYDKSGHLIGTLDGEGYLTQIVYDGASRVIQTTAFANATTSTGTLRATGTFGDLLTSAGTSTANDRTTRYVYDGESMLRYVIDAQNHVTAYGYQTTTSTTSEFGPVRVTTRYANTIAALNYYSVATVQAAITANTSYDRASYSVYDAAGRLAFTVDPTNAVTAFDYDGAGQLIRSRQFAARRTATTQPEFAEMGSWRTANSDATKDRVTRRYYNARGEIRYTVDGEGFATQFDYDAEGRTTGMKRWDMAISVNDGMGIDAVKVLPTGSYAATATTYDNEGRVATITDGESSVTRYEYNANGTLKSTYAADGVAADVVQTYFEYDGAGRVKSRYDAYGAPEQTLTQFSYNAFGEASSITDPNNAATTNSYDRLGQLLSVTDPLGGVTSFSYDPFGAVAKTTDANLKSSYVYYDTLGRVTATRDADNRVTQTTYNAFGEVETVTRRVNLASGSTASPPSVTPETALDQVISFVYDKAGRVANTTDAEAATTSFTYNAFGDVATETDPLGASSTILTTNTYDRRGLLKIQVVGPTSITTSFGYDAFGRVLTLTDANTKVTTNTYDKAGRLLTAKDALNNTTTYTYDKRGNLVAVKDAADKITRYVYDRQDRQIAVIDALGAVTVNSYDNNGNLVEARTYSSKINVTSLAPQVASGAYSALVAADGDHVVRYAYDADNRLRFTVDALMRVTENVYDAAGNVLRTIAYDGTISVGSYTVTTIAPQVAGLADAAGTRTTRMVYDAANQLSYTIDATNQVTRYFYDSFGNLTKRIEFAVFYTTAGDPAITTMDIWATTALNLVDARTTLAYYDRDNRLRYSIDALGFVTRQDYDKAGNVTRQTVYAGAYSATDNTKLADLDTFFTGTFATARVTQFSYDGVGRLETTTDPEGYVTKLVLDAMGRVLSSTAAFGLAAQSITAFTYDAVGQVLTRTDGSTTTDATVTAFVYDALGRMIQQTTANGTADAEVTKWEYDALGQVTKTTNAFGTANAISSYSYYDTFGNVAKTVDPRGNASFAFYDKLGRVKRQVDAQGYVTDTIYTRGDRIASVKRWANAVTGTVETTYPLDPTPDTVHDATTGFTYDRNDQLKSTTDAQGFVESYTLNAFGERVSVVNKLFGTSTYTFDRNGRVLTETLPVDTKNAGGTSIAIVNKYSYDARGNRIQMVEAYGAVEARTTNYVYDKLDRLTDVTHDAVIVVNDDMTSTSGAVPAEHYVYDARGNVIKTTDAAGAQTFTYYDVLDRKTAELSPVGTLTHYGYDANGNLISSMVFGDVVTLPTAPGGTRPSPINAANGRKVTYAYDALNRLKTTTMIALAAGDLRTGEWNGASYVLTTSGNIDTKLEYDANGNVTRQIDGRGNSVYVWYDKLGRKVAQVDALNFLTTWTLDAEGNALSETRYATTLSGFTPDVTAPTGSGAGRTTTFEYDRNGRRTKETRLAVESYTVSSGGVLSAVSFADAVINYQYNGLGEVISKIEANGDTTTFTYDVVGRLILETDQSFTGYTGPTTTGTLTPRTAYVYDGLNNLRSTRVQLNATANDTDDRITTYAYGAGGRLASVTDAVGFTHTYGYDIAGRQVRDSYTRTLADGTASLTEATVTRYDVIGRAITQTNARLSGATWVFTDASSNAYDAVRMRYNVYGEMTGRGVTAGPGLTALYQEVFDYDPAGRLWHSNSGDGVDRFYIYDKAGNQTLTLASTGANLSALTYANYTASLTTSGDTSTADAVTTITTYDERGQARFTLSPDRQLSTAMGNVTITTARYYNAFGEVSYEVDARNYVTTFLYNAMGRLVSRISPQVSVTAENGEQTNIAPTENYFYDISGRLIAVENANSVQAGLASPTDPYAHFYTTRLLLAGSGHGDADALVTKEFHPDSGVLETRYDVFGDVRSVINERGNTTLSGYDKIGRVTEVWHPERAANTPGNGATATQLVDHYVYDGLGQRTGHWNSQFGSGYVEKTDYDIKGRVTVTIGYADDTMTYRYDPFDASAVTSGLGTFGGWKKTVVNVTASVTSWTVEDYFGRTVDSRDYGGHDYDYTFDKAGRVVARSNSMGESLSFGWYNTGLAAGQTGTQGTASYGYDAAGNRTAETFARGGTTYRDAIADYDALGRMTRWEEHAAAVGGSTSFPSPVRTQWEYDANGNVRRTYARFVTLDAQGGFSTAGEQDYWYLYDKMNRFTLTQGTLTAYDGAGLPLAGDARRGFGTIGIGAFGSAITYNYDGSRASATFVSDNIYGQQWVIGYETGYYGWSLQPFTFQGVRREDYAYTTDGYLAASYRADTTVDPGNMPAHSDDEPEPVFTNPSGPGTLQTAITRDALGRINYYKEYGLATGYFERSAIDYDKANRERSETSISYRQETVGSTFSTYTTYITNTYTGGLLTQQYQDAYKGAINASGDTAAPDSRQTYSYQWWDGALQSGIDNDHDDNAGTAAWTTRYTFDASGHIVSARIEDQRARTVTYVSDQAGMIVDRDEADSLAGGDPRAFHYLFGGLQLGQVGNNGTDNVNYAASIRNRLTPSATTGGAFAGGSTAATPFADFDQSYDAINGGSGAQSGSSYTVTGGETLMAVAQSVWGDASLWYLIADANGLSGSTQLAPGQTLIIPNKVRNNRNASDTFRPYDPNEALGDTSPTSAKPPKKAKCGAFGQILQVIVAVAVTALVASLTGPGASLLGQIVGKIGAAVAGNIAGQVFGLATGVQQGGFSFKQVASTAIESLFSGSGSGNFAVDLAIGVARAVATQGIKIAVGLQKKFDFAAVAGDSLSFAVGEQLGGAFKPAENLVSDIGQRLVRGTAGALINATARSVIDGTDFGDNITAALPNIIGQTVGGIIADAAAGKLDYKTAHEAGEERRNAAREAREAKQRAAQPAASSGAQGAPVAGSAPSDPDGDIVITEPKPQWQSSGGTILIGGRPDVIGLPSVLGPGTLPALTPIEAQLKLSLAQDREGNSKGDTDLGQPAPPAYNYLEAVRLATGVTDADFAENIAPDAQLIDARLLTKPGYIQFPKAPDIIDLIARAAERGGTRAAVATVAEVATVSVTETAMIFARRVAVPIAILSSFLDGAPGNPVAKVDNKSYNIDGVTYTVSRFLGDYAERPSGFAATINGVTTVLAVESTRTDYGTIITLKYPDSLSKLLGRPAPFNTFVTNMDDSAGYGITTYDREELDLVSNMRAEGQGLHTIQNALEEKRAYRQLSFLQKHDDGHYIDRHGPQTSLPQQRIRATTGLSPDNVQGRPQNSSRFISWKLMLKAAVTARAIYKETGTPEFVFDMRQRIGEGYLKGGKTYADTSQVAVRFNPKTQMYTLFPLLAKVPDSQLKSLPKKGK